MEISGVDINPRQSFNCPTLLEPDYHHLCDAAWALIAHEKCANKNPIEGIFHPDNPLKDLSLRDRIKHYAMMEEITPEPNRNKKDKMNIIETAPIIRGYTYNGKSSSIVHYVEHFDEPEVSCKIEDLKKLIKPTTKSVCIREWVHSYWQ